MKKIKKNKPKNKVTNYMIKSAKRAKDYLTQLAGNHTGIEKSLTLVQAHQAIDMAIKPEPGEVHIVVNLKDKNDEPVDVGDYVLVTGDDNVGSGIYKVVIDLNYVNLMKLKLIEKREFTDYEKEHNIDYNELGYNWVYQSYKTDYDD